MIFIFKEEQRLKANLRRPIIRRKKIKEKKEEEAHYKRNLTLLACVAFFVPHTIHLLVLTTLLALSVFFWVVFNGSKVHCHPYFGLFGKSV